MYARLLRELLVSMDTSHSDIRHELVVECCKQCANDPLELTCVDELDVEYTPEQAIWWYTRPTFMYKMRFFIKDLHLQLEKLHRQYIQTLSSDSITVYRGLSLPNSGTLFSMGTVFHVQKIEKLTLGRYEDAEQAKIYSNLGSIYMDKRLYSQALSYFQQALKFNPNSAECHGQLGLVYQELNQHEKALEHLQRAIELNQATYTSSDKVAIQFNNLGTVYYKQKNLDQAKDSYERALKLRLEYRSITQQHWCSIVYSR